MVIKYNAEGEVEWGTSIGGGSTDYINSVVETTEGGYLIGGYFGSSSIDLGNGTTLTNKNSYEGMVIKYNAEGEVEWGTSIGGKGSDFINSVVETTEGGYLIGGYFGSSSIDLENGTMLTNHASISYDGMLIKLKEIDVPEIVVKDATSIGGSNDDRITSVVETTEGGYLIGGYFYSSIDLGNGTMLTNHGNYDGMLIKYNAEGEVEWGTSIGGSNDDRITSVVETTEGGYLIGGYFGSSSIDLGNGTTLTNKGSYDGMVIKYNVEGEVEWGTSIGGSNSDYINSVVGTTDGGYLIGGYFQSSSIDLGNGTTLTNHKSGYYDGMVIKYNAEGEVEWGTSIGGSNNDSITSVVETTEGGYLIGGEFNSSSIDLGNGKQISNHGSTSYLDGMVIKYNAEGEVEWGTSIGGSSNDSINSVVETTEGGYLIGGEFNSSSIELGNGTTLTNHGRYDGMVIKYNVEGEVEWGTSIGESSDDNINSVVETTEGGYLIGGYFSSSSIDLGSGKQISNHGSTSYLDGMVIKYNSEGEVEWGTSIGGSNNDSITSVVETTEGGYLIGGYFGSSIDLGNGTTLTNKEGSSDGMVIKIYAQIGVPEQEEIILENYRKQYKAMKK